MKIGIIGAGLSGIIAARELTRGGHTVELIEKSRSVGGRLATRRIGDGKADHGAVYFTVRGDDLKQSVQTWIENGWVRVWYADPYPRYVAHEGMNRLAKRLADGLTVRLNERVKAITFEHSEVHVRTDKAHLVYDTIIVTTPVPQALEMLTNLSLHERDWELQTVKYDPTLVGLFEFELPVTIGEDGILDQDLLSGMLKVINNRQKGISDTELVSVYMSETWSEKWYERTSGETLTEIERLLQTIIGDAPIRSKQLKRWRYAQATDVWNQPFYKLSGYPIYLAGDLFLEADDPSGRTRFESAYVSGLRVAEQIQRML